MGRHHDLRLLRKDLARTVNDLNKANIKLKKKLEDDTITDQEYEYLANFRERRDYAMKFLSVYKCNT